MSKHILKFKHKFKVKHRTVIILSYWKNHRTPRAVSYLYAQPRNLFLVKTNNQIQAVLHSILLFTMYLMTNTAKR